VELDSASFAESPIISIDYAVMEKSDRISVVPGDFGWNDVGSWSALCALNEADANGNHINDSDLAVLHQTENCDIHTQGRLVAALGVKNLLIADTPDALLVAAKDQTQDVKRIYEYLKANGHQTHRQHLTVPRPWGRYTILESVPGCKVKHLEINPGGAISLQLHRHRSEHWVVVRGMAEVTREEEIHFVAANESIYIKAGHKHRVANNGRLPLIIIEVQCGDYLEEDDIVRFHDSYGRLCETDGDTVEK
jgi:mannose-1-phosphate guanylyltransferase